MHPCFVACKRIIPRLSVHIQGLVLNACSLSRRAPPRLLQETTQFRELWDSVAESGSDNLSWGEGRALALTFEANDHAGVHLIDRFGRAFGNRINKTQHGLCWCWRPATHVCVARRMYVTTDCQPALQAPPIACVG